MASSAELPGNTSRQRLPGMRAPWSGGLKIRRTRQDKDENWFVLLSIW